MLDVYHNLSRRSFLGASALLGAVGLLTLAGCSSNGSGNGQPADAPAESPEPAPAPQQPESASVPEPAADSAEAPAAEGDSTASALGNVLVVYYSAQGHTKAVAEAAADALGAPIFELAPETPYTTDDLNWRDDSSRVNAEHNDEGLRDIPLVQESPDGFEGYDTILLGYPIWWGGASWVMNRFVRNNDFTGKTVIPFCTSQSSGVGASATNLAALAGTGDWVDGTRFSEGVEPAGVRAWADSLESEVA